MMTYGTNIKLVNFLDLENDNHTHNIVNTRLNELENMLNIHYIVYDTLTTGVKPSSNGQLFQCSWSSENFNKSFPYKMNSSVHWQIAMTAKIGFKL